MTEYVVLTVGDADGWWTTMSVEQRTAGYAEYNRFAAELTQRGHKIIAALGDGIEVRRGVKPEDRPS